ncbi:39S ribosomal protein L11 mitochondrial [Taenia crassiceps]|uniref:39S ribosomal protein L11 mitochondrial n=1 Tax=Taenia crassiceps TaxID=6207 RepID=A0ABR4QJ08_9CEST
MGKVWAIEVCLGTFFETRSSFGLLQGTEVSGQLTLKHIYEIALLKSEDAALRTTSLQGICASLISEAHRVGIEVLSREEEAAIRGDPESAASAYAEFLRRREEEVAQRKKALEERKQAKMMRVS